MEKQTVAKILASTVMITGVVVMFGWVADIPILTSILPQWVTMKFTTALSFFLSGIVLYFIAISLHGRRDLAQIVLPVATLLILLLMATLLASVFLSVKTGVEDLFVKEAAGAVKTTVPGRPSAGTMISFIMVAISGIFVMFRPKNIGKILFWFGVIVGSLGAFGVLGYIISVPLLYYTLEGWSTAMALHTAILFTLLGLGLVFLGMDKPKIDTKLS